MSVFPPLLFYLLKQCTIGTIQEARHKTVELSVEFPQRPNHGNFSGISTESSTETKLWNLMANAEIPRKVPQELNRGISTETSTVLSVGLSEDIQQKVPQFGLCGAFRGNSPEISMVWPLWNFLWKFP